MTSTREEIIQVINTDASPPVVILPPEVFDHFWKYFGNAQTKRIDIKQYINPDFIKNKKNKHKKRWQK